MPEDEKGKSGFACAAILEEMLCNVNQKLGTESVFVYTLPGKAYGE